MKTDILKQKFTALYDVESDAIFRYCLLRTSNREQALDLTQETFTRFWQTLLDGKEIKSSRTFLFTVAKNLVIDWYRKKKAVSLDALLQADDYKEPPALREGGSRDTIEIAAEGRYLLDRIQELDPLYQQVVYLRFVEDLKPKEIAEILGESVNVVSVRITRGIQELREIVGQGI